MLQFQPSPPTLLSVDYEGIAKKTTTTKDSKLVQFQHILDIGEVGEANCFATAIRHGKKTENIFNQFVHSARWPRLLSATQIASLNLRISVFPSSSLLMALLYESLLCNFVFSFFFSPFYHSH